MTTNRPLSEQQCVLCIDPTGELCLLLGRMLRSNDIMVCQIRKIDEAASFMEHRTCVVIILENTFCDADLRMQVINIKRLAPFARILMISAIGEETAENAVSAGVDVFLTKPFSKKTLTEAVLANVRRA